MTTSSTLSGVDISDVLALLWVILVSAFGFVWLTGEPYIQFLKRQYLGQYIREDGPQSHHSKAGTPTAGGLLILGGMLVGLLTLVALEVFHSPWLPTQKLQTSDFWLQVLLLALPTLLLGLLGFYDDFLKIAKKQNKGLHGYGKLGVQALIGLGIGCIVPESAHQVSFFNGEIIDLGGFYPLFAMLIVIATSNAVNLTDGLDGLAAGTVSCSLIGAMILLGVGFLTTPMTADPTLLISLCLAASLLGATLGFLMFNRHPARIFMGDCGSLALGGALATLAILGHFEFWLLLIGGLYVVEALSVILQVLSFKTTGKRIFRMSPIHHHFELGGWHETKVVKYFIIFQFLLCLVAVFLYNTK